MQKWLAAKLQRKLRKPHNMHRTLRTFASSLLQPPELHSLHKLLPPLQHQLPHLLPIRRLLLRSLHPHAHRNMCLRAARECRRQEGRRQSSFLRRAPLVAHIPDRIRHTHRHLPQRPQQQQRELELPPHRSGSRACLLRLPRRILRCLPSHSSRPQWHRPSVSRMRRRRLRSRFRRSQRR